jgi:hypothetical protein
LEGAALQCDDSPVAANMAYTEILFAIGFEKMIWGTNLTASSLAGAAVIIASAIYITSLGDEAKAMTSCAGGAEEGSHSLEDLNSHSLELEDEDGMKDVV